MRLPLVFALCAAAPLGAAEVTYTRDVAPILFKHCTGCHHDKDIAPMSLMSYKETRPWAAAIREAVLGKRMPPWKADPHYGKWANDFSLKPAEIQTIKAWVDGGKLEGDPKVMPAAPVYAEGWKAGKPDLVVPIEPYTLKGKGADENLSFTVDPHFTEDKWIVSAELRPGNLKIVHHSHVFVVDPDEKKGPAKKDPAVEYARWLMLHEGTLSWIRPEAPVIDNGCAVDDNGAMPGSVPTDLGSLIGSYLPGRDPDVYPEGTARLIKAGSKLRFQMHYSRATGKDEVDITSVGLRFAKEPPKTVARRFDFGNHMFRIPAGASEHPVSECHTFQKDMYITSLTPHMHLRGKSMRMEVTYPDGRKETLLNVPAYDFNWQITYRAEKPIFIPKGTRLALYATFDNSKNNPLNPDATTPIRWGSASENEMMDGWVEYVDAPMLGSLSAAR